LSPTREIQGSCCLHQPVPQRGSSFTACPHVKLGFVVLSERNVTGQMTNQISKALFIWSTECSVALPASTLLSAVPQCPGQIWLHPIVSWNGLLPSRRSTWSGLPRIVGEDKVSVNHGGPLPCEPWRWPISDHSHVREEHSLRLGLGLSDRRRVALGVSCFQL
jgi:hypothetical protein